MREKDKARATGTVYGAREVKSEVIRRSGGAMSDAKTGK
jgi:hypothetical protein